MNYPVEFMDSNCISVTLFRLKPLAAERKIIWNPKFPEIVCDFAFINRFPSKQTIAVIDGAEKDRNTQVDVKRAKHIWSHTFILNEWCENSNFDH